MQLLNRLIKFICGFGLLGLQKGEVSIQQPTPPPQPSTADAIQAWQQSLPSVYETQMQYEPQLMQQQLDLAVPYAEKLLDLQNRMQMEYAPEQAEQQYEIQQKYAPEYAALQRDITQSLYPETAGLQENLAQQAREGMTSSVPDWMKKQYRSDMAAQLGTNVAGGIGADYMSRGLMQQEQDWQNYYRNLGLSMTGRQPLTQPSTVGTPQINTPMYQQQLQYGQGFNPNAVMGQMGTNYGNYSQAYSNMYNTNANYQLGQQQNQNQMIGSLVGGIGSMVGGLI